ncbi:ATP-binding cassette domain-containing protein [Chromobacterium haemolyticum]|nr:ATP-binding cassette domain-containing protein [Chromobacterium haemolyticum]
MALITVEKACLAFGHHALLDNVDFALEPGEVVGLIGRNGAGKSSLLKSVAGAVALDDGRVNIKGDVKVAYVPQEPELAPEHTVFEAVAEGLGDLKSLLTEYHQVTHQLTQADADHEQALTRMEHIQHELEARGGWQFDALISSTLSHLNLNPDARISELSGGWKKRVALARALAAKPDVLLLDEPTNHLDVSAIEWLETLIKSYGGSVLLITHDRRFLDNVATRIVELDRGILRSYPGSFSSYHVRKAEELAIEEEQNRIFDKFHAQEEVWIRKGIEARRTRNEGRVRRLEAIRRRERSARRERVGQVNFQLNAGERSGKLVAELEHVSKGFEGKTLIRDFTTRILRGDKIGLIGPNGAGKTTLLKLILGQLDADSGSVKQGSKLEIAYFDQFREQLDEDSSVADIISQGNDFVEVGGVKKHVMSYLEDFLFSPQRARSPVRSLSGGERNRLLLARLFTRPANVLVLDEPTNDLDIDTLELLEDVIAQYSGTVFLVSHDRAFLDNVVTQVIAFEGNGRLEEYPGGYQDWIDTKARMAAMKPTEKPREAAAPQEKAKDKPKSARNKLSYNETRELAALPDEIAALETEQASLNQQLLDPNCYRDTPKEAIAWQRRVEEIDELLMDKLARWEELESKQQ